MLLEGSNVTHSTNQNVLTCAQLLLYNFKPRTKYLTRPTENDEVKPNSETIYHSKMRETPAVIYNSLKIYAPVRSENLINKLYSLGLYIPYKRVFEITKNMAEYNQNNLILIKFSFQSAVTKMSLLSSQKIISI